MGNENSLSTPVAAARSRQIEREIWLGLFVMLGLLAIVVVLFLGTDPSMFRGSFLISTTVPNAGGVRKGDPVQLRGVTVGKVRGFHLQADGVAIEMEIDREFKIPEGSRVKLVSNALLGGSTADIVPGQSQRTVPPGSMLPGQLESGSFGQVGEVADDAERALNRVEKLLSDETVENVETSTDELARVLTQASQLLGDPQHGMTGLTRSLNQSARGVERVATGPELDQIMKQMESISRRMDGVAASLDGSAASARTVMDRLEQGEGSLGRLSRDEALYSNANRAVVSLGNAAGELTRLVEDVRKNPKRYINLRIF